MARQCFYIPIDGNPDGKGFIPSLVTEGEPGHSPMGDWRSDGISSPLPYRWGNDYDEAVLVAERTNLSTFGLDREACIEIVASSMGASIRASR
jgi:hypothetical protein